MAGEDEPIMSTRKELLRKYQRLCQEAQSLVASFPFGKDNILFMEIFRKKLYCLTW